MDGSPVRATEGDRYTSTRDASAHDERSKSRKRSRSEERAGVGEPGAELARAAPASLLKQDALDGGSKRDDRGKERASSASRAERDGDVERERERGREG